MKTLFIYLAVLLIASVSVVQAQEQKVYKGQVLVKQDSYKIKRDVLYVNMIIEVSGLAVGRYQKLILTPVLRAGNKDVSLQPIVLNGVNRHKMYRRAVEFDGHVIAKEGAYMVLKNEPEFLKQIAYEQTIAYKDWMKDAQLVLIGELCDYKGTPCQVMEDELTGKIEIKQKEEE